MRKGEIRSGGVSGSVEGSLGEDWNEGVKSKYRVGLHVSEWDAIRKC